MSFKLNTSVNVCTYSTIRGVRAIEVILLDGKEKAPRDDHCDVGKLTSISAWPNVK